jgi:hypothetical protein
MDKELYRTRTHVMGVYLNSHLLWKKAGGRLMRRPLEAVENEVSRAGILDPTCHI